MFYTIWVHFTESAEAIRFLNAYLKKFLTSEEFSVNGSEINLVKIRIIDYSIVEQERSRNIMGVQSLTSLLLPSITYFKKYILFGNLKFFV